MVARKSGAMASALDFQPDDKVPCNVCGKADATHEISINCHRGFDYNHAKRVFSVSYSVCHDCAREIVTVKLGADLKGGGAVRS